MQSIKISTNSGKIQKYIQAHRSKKNIQLKHKKIRMIAAIQTRLHQLATAYANSTFIICCCILAAWFAASATNEITKDPLLVLASATKGSADSDQQRPTLDSFTNIIARNLLGVLTIAPNVANFLDKSTTSTSQQSTIDDVDAIPISTQPWTLLGTIVDEEATQKSRAIVLVEGEQALYTAGDSIEDWEVILVQRGSVVLSQGERQERLVINGGKDLLADRPDIQRTLKRRKLQAVLRDIPTLMRALVVSPQQAGNRQGLGIVSIDTSTYLNELGLHVGDVLLTLNNSPLRGFGDLAGFMTLVNNDTITLEIMRAGKPTIIRYHMEK